MELNIPGYKLKRVIGKGGMARVYLAEQKVFGRDVALKLMSKHLSEDPNFGKRFLREAQIVAKLVHPNIVTVHDVGVHDGYYYLSMEYIDGRDLKARGKHLSLVEKINAIRDIAKALDYAGSKGYVHRDIKPENIMFHKSDNRAVLTDFGIARAAETDLAMTQTGIAIGTPHYMSPEQAKGKAVDGRSDIYSLGVVFYLLLVGEVPYNAESAVAIGIKHITEPVPLLPPAYEGLQSILDLMLGKVVDERYQSAAELIDDLDTLNISELEGLESRYKNEPVVSPVLNVQSRSELNKSLSNNDNFSITEESIRALPNPIVIWPWLISLVLVCSLVFGALYILRPAPLVPYINKLENLGLHWKEQIKNALSSGDALLDNEDVPVKDLTMDASIASQTLQSIEDKQTTDALPSTNTTQNHSVSSVSSVETNLNETSVLLQKQNTDNFVSQSQKEIPDSVNDFVLEKYRNQLLITKNAYEKDSERVVEYVDAHRDLLANYANDQKTLDSLNNLQTELKNNLLQKARVGKPTTALKLLTQYRYLFSNLPKEDKVNLEKQLSNIAKSRSHTKKADQYFKQQSLSKPKGSNAIESYQKALELDRLNANAKAGMNKTLNTLVSFAQENQKNGRNDIALSQAELVLSYDSDNTQAKNIVVSLAVNPQRGGDKVSNSVSDSITLGSQLKSLYAQAIDARDRGDLYEPTRENAYDFYQTMLNYEANNIEAEQGLGELLVLLTQRVDQYLSSEELINARSILYRPLEVMPSNRVVQSLNDRVELAIQQKQQSVLPKIEIIISNESQGQSQNQPLSDSALNSNTTAINSILPWYLFLTYDKITAQNSNINIDILGLPDLNDVFSISKTLQGSSGTLTLSSLDFDLSLGKGSYQVQISIGARTGNANVMDRVVFTVY